MKTKDVAKYIIDWLTSYIEDAKLDGFVIGVSGGIDSAVTASLCARTGRQTFLVNMPIHQATSELSRSDELIAGLDSEFENVSSLNVDLTGIYEGMKTALPVVDKESRDLALANTRAR